MITGAAPRVRPRLKRLIYWSAFVPAEGKLLYDEAPPPYQDLFTAQADASGNNSVAMPFEAWQQAFTQDAGTEAQRIMHSLLVPHPMQYFTETVDAYDPAGDELSASYVLSSDDVALPPGEFGWARFAERLGSKQDRPPAPGSTLNTGTDESSCLPASPFTYTAHPHHSPPRRGRRCSRPDAATGPQRPPITARNSNADLHRSVAVIVGY